MDYRWFFIPAMMNALNDRLDAGRKERESNEDTKSYQVFFGGARAQSM